MGLRTKFNLVMLVGFLVGLALAATFAYAVIQRNARDAVLQQARLMIEQASAVRGYTDKQIGPLLSAQSNVHFLPQTIPFWAAQTVFKQVQAGNPDYGYKEAALNPTNPADRATDWQADIIDTFRHDPARAELVTERQTPNGPTINLARPIRVDNPDCLGCHSTPQAAPATMIELYGTANGFGWHDGDTVGAQIVSVPESVALDAAYRLFGVMLAGLVGVFAIITIILNVLLHVFVIRPVKRMSAFASDVSLGQLDAPEFTPRGRDEIASLAVSFNRMRRSLVNALAMLETAD